jgi:O-methyltransferase
MYSFRRLTKAAYWLCFGLPYQKRRVKQELARICLSLFGDFYLSDDYQRWRNDREFLAQYRRVSPLNPYSQDRKFVLREFVKHTNRLPGFLAECGCYEGASAWFIANEAPTTPFYLFDSFEGLSNPATEDDPGHTNIFPWVKGDLSASEEKVRRTLEIFNEVRYMKGWIPERYAEARSFEFRLVHIDVDLYQPTFDSVSFFYPRLVQGGVIVLDDYGSTACPGAYKAANDFMENKLEHVILLPTGQGLIIKL